MSEVEITNVGGPRPRDGVASEATLAALLAAVERGGGSNRSQTSARIQEQYDRAVRNGTQSQGLLSKAITTTADAVVNLGKELAMGGNRASDFSEALFGSTSIITKFINYLDSTVDIFRDLTSVGASFNNSITQMIAASAASSMSLSDFANMVRNNSESFASFGGTVTSGARVFGDFSKQFRNTTGRTLFEMGFSIADINEGLVGFFEIERMRSGQALRLDRSRNQVANEYILQLDRLAKVTGRQRKEIEAALQKQMQDAGIRNQINRLSGQEQANLQETLAFLDTELPGYSDALRDLMDGVAQGAGRALENQVPGMTDFMQEVYAGRVSLEEFINAMTSNVLPTLEAASASTDKSMLDAMRERGGIVGEMASLYDNLYQLNRLSGRDYQLALQEQNERADLINRTLGPFEQSIIDLRKSIVDAFFEMGGASGGVFDAFLELGDAIRELFLPGVSGSLPSIGEKLKDFIGFLVGPEGILTKGIRTFTRFLRSDDFSNFIDNIKTKISEFTDYLGNIFYDEEGKLDIFAGIKTMLVDIFEKIKDFIFGKEVEIREGPEVYTERQGGLLNSIQNLFEGEGTGTFLDDVYESVKLYLFGGTTTAGTQQTGLLTDAYEWLKLTLFGGTTASGTQQTGLLTDAYEWLKRTLFGGETEGGTQQTGLLQTAYDWVLDKLFPADQPNMQLWDRIKDTIMDTLFGEQVAIPFTDQEVRPGQIAFLARVEKFLNDYIGLSYVQAQAGGPSLWEQFWSNVGLNVAGETTLWQAILDKVGLTSGQPLLPQIQQKIEDALLGKRGMNEFGEMGRGERTGGILESITTGFTNLFNRPEIINSMSNAISNLATATLNGLTDFWNAPENAQKIDNMIDSLKLTLEEGLLELLELLNTGFAGWFIDDEELRERRRQLELERGRRESTAESRAAAASVGLLPDEAAEARISEMTPYEQEVAALVNELEFTRNAIDEMKRASPYAFTDSLENRVQSIIEALRALGVEGYNQGTNGFQNFGRGSIAMLHGTEAVVPRNSPAGEILQAFFDSQNKTANTAQATMPATARSQDQTMLMRKLDELNTTMIKVAEYLEEGLGIQNKTMRGIRNFGGDYMRGVGR